MDALRNWENWSYGQWNGRLISHYFGTDDLTLLADTVDRLPATPEDLALAAGASISDADSVAAAFIRRIVEELPLHRVSFCGFCLDQKGWTPRWPEPPHFFGMLWFTCLVAYGYPKAEGDFSDRIAEIFGKRDNFRTRDGACLPSLWRDFALWTRNRHEEGDWIRILELPPADPQREVIGFSHFLAFPNRIDRRELARVLWESGLVGFEPPIQPLLRAIETRRNNFSVDFREDLDLFIKRFAAGDDPRASAFWRAVRQEALEPSVDDTGAQAERSLSATFVFVGTEDGLLPVVAIGEGYRLPPGFEARAFEEEPGPWHAYVVWKEGDLETPWLAAFVDGAFLGIGVRKLVVQGLLVLRESISGQFEIATGADIHGCSVALVRTPLVAAFTAAFGGTAIPSIVCDWCEVTGCEVRQVEATPPGLDGLTQLLPTMAPPSVSLLGGVRVGGGFLFVPPFFPSVRAPGAEELQVSSVANGVTEQCAQVSGTFDWTLPPSVDRPGEYTLRATWIISPPSGGTIQRSGETRLRFVDYVVDDVYKGKPTGGFFVESCPQGELDVTKLDEVPFGITTQDSARSTDLIETESSARFLGPGHGEMSLGQKPGFDWLVIGPKKSPELLVFVGDAGAPTPPAQRRSPQTGDRRHWRIGFRAGRVFARVPDGSYQGLEEAPPAVRDALTAYRRHQVADNAPECAETSLEAMTDAVVVREQPSPRTQQAIDVLAALSSRRSGLGYQQVRELFAELSGNDDPIVFQQVLHGWTEAGIVDVLREAVVSRFTIVARRPRLVIVKRGPELEATLIGMLSTVRRNRFEEQLRVSGAAIKCKILLPGCPWQPTSFRLRGPLDAIESLRRRTELGPSEWLDWPTIGETPKALDVGAALASLPRSIPPSSFRTDAVWNWDLLSFQRGRVAPDDGIQLERRIHRDFSTIYVVLERLESKVWTHSRSWALLVAYGLRGTSPFATDGFGMVWSQGRAPVHLPLPIGRLCALIGEGLPGPVITGSPSGVLRHVYPFGRRLHALVERVLPPNWIDQPLRRANAGSNR